MSDPRIAVRAAARLAVLVAALFLAASCGGGGGSEAPPAGAPTISNLTYSPSAVYVSVAPVQFSGQVQFADPDGDLASATLNVVDARGATLSSQTVPIQAAAGATSGTIQGTVTAAASVAGNYTLQVYVTDRTGLQSNVLSGAVRIANNPWTSRTPGPTPRACAAVAVVGGRLYVLGGQRTDTDIASATAIVEIYDPSTDTWSPAPPMPTARTGLVAAALNGNVYAIGGYLPNETGVVEAYDPVAKSWTAKSPMPTPRKSAAGAAVGPQIVVAGGAQVLSLSNAVEAYDPGTDSWTRREDGPVGAQGAAAVAADGRLYVVGGWSALGLHGSDFISSRFESEVYAYDPGSDTWVPRAPMSEPRAWLALAEVSGRLVAAGGTQQVASFGVMRQLDLVEVYDIASNTWSVKTPSPRAFSCAAAGVVNGKVYIFGNGFTLEYDPANEIR